MTRGQALALSAALGIMAAPAVAQQVWTFPYAGQPYTFQVPPGISQLVIDVQGGRGGQPTGGNGGRAGTGGRTIAKMLVSPADILSIFVGGSGDGHSGPGLGNGGNKGLGKNFLGSTGYDGGGGGGGSVVGKGVGQPFNEYVAAGGGGGGGGNTDSLSGRCGGDGGNAGNPPQDGEQGCVEISSQEQTEDPRGGGEPGSGGGSGSVNGGDGTDGVLVNGINRTSAGGGGGGGGGYIVNPSANVAVVSGGGGGGGGTHLYSKQLNPDVDYVIARAGGGGGGGVSSVDSGGATSLVAYVLSNGGSDGVVTLFVGGAEAFLCTNGPQQFPVPADVFALNVEARGAQGGAPDSGAAVAGDGGYGGVTIGTVPVTPGEILTFSVGCKGEGRGGFGDGRGGDKGDGNAFCAKDGAGGGGSSGIRRADGTRLLVAGGGGGGAGSGCEPDIGKGGDGGAGGAASYGPVDGSGGGPFGGGGAGGYGGCQADTGDCRFNPNGTPGGTSDTAIGGGGGGGGGGGYMGGFGGHSVPDSGYIGGGAGGGGGGRSYVDPRVLNAGFQPGLVRGDGTITVTWATSDTPLTLRVCPSGCAYSSIQAAVNAAQSNGSIQIGPGTYAENVTIDKSLLIAGASAASTTIDGGGNGTVLTVSAGVNVTLHYLTLTNGSAPLGGGIRNFGTLVMAGNVVTNNKASSGGGGISNETGGSLSIYGGAIVGNYAADRGAGLINGAGAQMFIQSMLISGNNTAGEGAGLYVSGGDVAVQGTGISNNHAQDGGGVAIAAGTTNVFNSDISGNSAGQRGGGFFVVSGTLNADTVGVSKNGIGMTKGGGAFFNQRGRVALYTVSVTQNSPPQCVNVKGC